MIFEKIDPEVWMQERSKQPWKDINKRYIKDLNDRIESAISGLNLDGSIIYRNSDSKTIHDGKFLYYNYGSPAPWLCKILPQGYGFSHFEPNDIYKQCPPIIGFQSKLLSLYDKGLFTRYIQPPAINVNLPDDYVLVSMQNVGSTAWYRKNFTDMAEQIVAWSRENKRNVIFKWHNGCQDHRDPTLWFDSLKEKSSYATIEYTLPLNILIKNCSMLWSASSMSGIEALICNKPVALFGISEYMEMATVANNPEDAAKCVVHKDVEQWLTYYVTKYCINTYSKDCVSLIRNRIINHFERDLPLHELILS